MMNRITDTVKHLIIINAIVFAITFVFQMGFSDSLALYFPENEKFGFWQFLTHMFVHGSPMHIIFNMYGLWAFGSPLEQMWGRNKFLFFYFSAGFGAAAVYTLVNYYQFNNIQDYLINAGVTQIEISQILNSSLITYDGFFEQINSILSNNTSINIQLSGDKLIEIHNTYHTAAVGASGAVYGILVAYAVAFPNAKLALIFLPIPISAKYFIPVILLGDLFFGMTNYSVGNIAHFAHLGGALIGFIIAWYWKKNQFNRWN